MIGRAQARRWATDLGVPVEQVEGDHLISHVLAWLSSTPDADAIRFIGGTALARTHLEGLRLSEDVDLLVHDVERTAAVLVDELPEAVRAEYPALTLAGPRPGPRGRVVGVLADGGPHVQVDFMAPEPAELQLEFAPAAVSLRYERLPASVQLLVPTPASFVAMKIATYRDRAEPRDLFDLARLALGGHLTEEAKQATRGLTGAQPTALEFQSVPDAVRAIWHDRLGHQVRDPGSPDSALAAVVAALDG